MLGEHAKTFRKPFGRRRAPVRTTGERLAAALLALGEGKGRIVIHTETPWASITFAGTRHRLKLAFHGADAVEAGERFIAELSDHEFAIPGQIVAEARVVSADQAMLPDPALRIDAELLLLNDS